MISFSSSKLVYVAIIAVLGYYGSSQFAVWSARRRMIKQYGCKPPPNYDDDSPSWLPSLYNMKQINFVKKNGAACRLQEATHERYLDHGLTHTSKVNVQNEQAEPPS